MNKLDFQTWDGSPVVDVNESEWREFTKSATRIICGAEHEGPVSGLLLDTGVTLAGYRKFLIAERFAGNFDGRVAVSVNMVANQGDADFYANMEPYLSPKPVAKFKIGDDVVTTNQSLYEGERGTVTQVDLESGSPLAYEVYLPRGTVRWMAAGMLELEPVETLSAAPAPVVVVAAPELAPAAIPAPMDSHKLTELASFRALGAEYARKYTYENAEAAWKQAHINDDTFSIVWLIANNRDHLARMSFIMGYDEFAAIREQLPDTMGLDEFEEIVRCVSESGGWALAYAAEMVNWVARWLRVHGIADWKFADDLCVLALAHIDYVGNGKYTSDLYREMRYRSASPEPVAAEVTGNV